VILPGKWLVQSSNLAIEGSYGDFRSLNLLIGGFVTQSPKKRTVLFDHDGGVDDLLSLMMLLAMPHINLVGIVVTPADCFLRPAVSASFKILRFFGRLDIELSEGVLYGVNPFPQAWRAHAYPIDALPILNELKQPENKQDRSSKPAGAFFSQPGKDVFNELRDHIYNKIVPDLAPVIAIPDVEAVRQVVQEIYIKLLVQENIILSQAEQNRLFEVIFEEVLQKVAVNRLPKPVSEPGHEFLARKLRGASEPVTILITGPVSNLSVALSIEPDLATKIEEVVWMGGALNVPGNVRDYEHDGSAEWNAYWDPPSTHRLWQFDVPITIFPLDATNHVRVTLDFLHRLAQQRKYPLSDLAGQCWALTVGTIPAYEYTYHMWDTLTTGYLGAPQYISFRQARSEVIPYGPSAGQVKEVSEDGRLIKAAQTVQVEEFQHYLLELFRR
jgi:inosine-uridine nucleoside N-ribohydrolase